MTNTIDDSFSSTPTHQDETRLLSHIAVRNLSRGGVAERVTLLRVEEILYFFTAGALSQRPVIDAKWRDLRPFSPGRVYVRTTTDLFVSQYRTIAKILARLPNQFIGIHKSLVVNFHQIKDLDFDGKLKRVGVVTAISSEWLTVSRRALKRFRSMLGM